MTWVAAALGQRPIARDIAVQSDRGFKTTATNLDAEKWQFSAFLHGLKKHFAYVSIRFCFY